MARVYERVGVGIPIDNRLEFILGLYGFRCEQTKQTPLLVTENGFKVVFDNKKEAKFFASYLTDVMDKVRYNLN